MYALASECIKLFLSFFWLLLFRLRNGLPSLTDVQAQDTRREQAGDFVQPLFGEK